VPAYNVTLLREEKSDLALVIPVINENGRLTRQLEQIRSDAPDVDVIIADGGSTDGSTDTESLHELGVTTLLTKIGPGKLSAQLRMAIHHCLNHPYKAVITMDGNGKDGVGGITTIATALRNGYDFVQGSRFVSGGEAINTPPDRYLAIRLVHAPFTSLGARHWFTDTTNGFRGHSRRLLEDSRVAPLRAEFDTYELLAYLPIRAARLGFRITEVPVTRAYPRGDAIPTKIQGCSAHAHLLQILVNASTGRYNPRP
jgi:dolichol-phosphate mannosyltransferase